MLLFLSLPFTHISPQEGYLSIAEPNSTTLTLVWGRKPKMGYHLHYLFDMASHMWQKKKFPALLEFPEVVSYYLL
jgi:hypothetical protein